MPRLRRHAPLAAMIALSACGSESSVDAPNPAIADQVNEAASRIEPGDGRIDGNMPMTPEDVGTAMRASGRDRPGRHY